MPISRDKQLKEVRNNLPDWGRDNENIVEMMLEWVQHRKRIKKVVEIGSSAWKWNLKRIDNINIDTGEPHESIIARAVGLGWQSFFADKNFKRPPRKVNSAGNQSTDGTQPNNAEGDERSTISPEKQQQFRKELRSLVNSKDLKKAIEPKEPTKSDDSGVVK